MSNTDVVEVVDGFKRLRAARELGWSELRVEIVVTDTGSQAKLLVLQTNRRDVLTDLEQAWVIRSLYREDGLTQPQIARLLCRDKSWVCRRLMLAEGLAPGVEADVRLGLLSASAAREVVRLPRGNQEACARVVLRRGLTTRQTAKLVDRLLLAEAAGRAEMLAQAEAGEGIGEARGKPVKGQLSHGEWLSVDVTTLKRATVRLHSRLLQRPLASLGESAAELARRDLRELVPSLVSLNQTIEKACHGTHTGRSDAAIP
jgi:ParB-like chromosome segregation protein Spo0J